MSKKQMSVRQVYFGSNGGETRSVLCRLRKHANLGLIAAELFRAQKASSRAKQYRGGIRSESGGTTSYRDLAYNRKEDALSKLSKALMSSSHDLQWGWGIDEKMPYAFHVLYVDLPDGQCSFHSPERYAGPDYGGTWDGKRESEVRILGFCEQVMRSPIVEKHPESETPKG